MSLNEEERLQAMKELITLQYESVGFAVLEIDIAGPGMFKLEIIDANGPREVFVTVLLHMVPIHASIDKR